MRTRLDEIVEEEGAITGDHKPSITDPEWRVRRSKLQRIAERAFRHGVEQGHEEFGRPDECIYQKCHDTEAVQPAPAQEEAQLETCVRGRKHSPTAFCTCWCHGDRRKA